MTPIEANFSSIWLALMALIGGLVCLIAGGESLVSGAIKIADRLGMSPLLVGLTVVAFGTSMPELFVSLKASFSNHSDIMVGNVVGSNIANIALVLAFCAVLAPLKIDFSRLKVEFYLLLGSYLVLMAIVAFGSFSRLSGLLFTVSLAAYTVAAYWREVKKANRKSVTKKPPHKKSAALPLTAVLVILGLFLMWLGSDYFIKGAVDIARFFGLPELVIGLSIAAVGTSLPELASSISAIRRRSTDILVGNIIGSNIFNLLLVMGLTGVLKPFSIPAQILHRDLPLMLASTLILLPISLRGKTIKRWHGLALLTAYATYIFILS